MGIALGDVSGTGFFDLYVTHLTEETNTLWRQESAGLFREVGDRHSPIDDVSYSLQPLLDMYERDSV